MKSSPPPPSIKPFLFTLLNLTRQFWARLCVFVIVKPIATVTSLAWFRKRRNIPFDVCVCVLLQLLKELIDFHDIRHGGHTIWGHSDDTLFFTIFSDSAKQSGVVVTSPGSYMGGPGLYSPSVSRKFWREGFHDFLESPELNYRAII